MIRLGPRSLHAHPSNDIIRLPLADLDTFFQSKYVVRVVLFIIILYYDRYHDDRRADYTQRFNYSTGAAAAAAVAGVC